MSVDEAKLLVRRIYRAFNERDAEALEHLLSADFIDHTAGDRQKSGIEGIRDVWASIWSKYPAIQIWVEDMFGEGDRPVARVTLQSSSDEGELASAIEIFQLADGRVIGLWNILSFSTS